MGSQVALLTKFQIPGPVNLTTELGVGYLTENGAQIRADIANPPFATVADVMDIGGPKWARVALDATSHDAVDGWQRYIPGLKAGGEVTFDVLYDPGEDTQGDLVGELMYGLASAAGRVHMRIVFPDGASTWAFDGIVLDFSSSFPVADMVKAAVTIQLTGQPTLT